MILYTACDAEYLRQHGQSFVAGAAYYGMDVNIDVVVEDGKNLPNAVFNCWSLFEKLKKREDQGLWIGQASPLEPGKIDRTYYASHRFLAAPYLQDAWYDAGILMVDIDCLIRQSVQPLSGDYGLFLRNPLPGTEGWEQEGTRVAAGAVWLHGCGGKLFAQSVEKFLKVIFHPRPWFSDQVALWRTHQLCQMRQDHKLKFTQIPFELIDWEFGPASAIWTGKGDRKHTNQKYLELKNEYERWAQEVLKT